MKSTNTSFRDHLDQPVTALCTCWTIKRTDGVELRFTDADEDVVQGGKTYTSIGAYQRTAIESTSTLSVDNLEIVGASNDLSLPDEELRAGLFDNAQITIFMTPWLDSVRGQLKLRRGFFGEVQTLPNGTYQVELRGIMQKLAYNYTDIFSATCLYDLGQELDSKGMGCGIPIKGKDMNDGTYFRVGQSARIAQSSYKRGKVYSVNIGDPDFEFGGSSGDIEKSVYWFNRGATNVVRDLSQKYTGTHSARGGSGSSILSQDVDLEDSVGASVSDIDSGDCYVTTRVFRRDVGSTGQMRLQFLDRNGSELGFGQVISLNSGGITPTPMMFSGDFTVELWIKPSGAADGNQVIFGGGRFGTTGGTTGTFLALDGGLLSFWGDDNVYNYSGVGGTSNNGDYVVRSANEITADTWTHIALERDGSDFNLYVNFKLAGTSDAYTGDVWIDLWADSVGRSGFVGKWDELRVWNSARGGEQLALNAHQPIDSSTPSLIRYYNFNDVTGSDLTGSDATFSFVSGGAVLQQGQASPVAVPAVFATALGTATYTSGFADTGPAWNEIGVEDHRIPPRTRRMRISLEATGNQTWFDNITGHIINTNEEGPVIGYMTNDIAWRCTSGGTTDANQATGTEGSTINVNGVAFVGEDAYLRAARVLSVIDNRTFIIEVNDPRAVDGWFNEGSAIFETGKNAGTAMEVKGWKADTRQLELFLSMPNPVKAGDYLSVYPGCDKSRICCAAIFKNIKNFFGTPDVPGQDELFRYPDSK